MIYLRGMLPSILLLNTVISHDIIRLNLTHRIFSWQNRVYDIITAPIWIDNQCLNVMVDTGSPQTFVVSDKALYNTESCKSGCISALYHCYQELSCDNESRKVGFVDGTRVDLIDHEGDLNLGNHAVSGIKFAIAMNYTSRHPPLPMLGLGLTAHSGGFHPILDQLASKGVIKDKEFSMYFYPGNMDEGELLLGGGDPRKYDGELMSVPLIDEYEWIVKLDNIAIDGIPILEKSYPILLDTGSNLFMAPLEVLDKLLARIKKSSKHAGRDIKFHWTGFIPYLEDYQEARLYLPTIHLILGGSNNSDVILMIPPELYTIVLPSGACAFRFNAIAAYATRLTLGINIIRNYYLNFNKEQRQINIARSAREPQIGLSLKRSKGIKRLPSDLSTYSSDDTHLQF